MIKKFVGVYVLLSKKDAHVSRNTGEISLGDFHFALAIENISLLLLQIFETRFEPLSIF